jgi:predicted CXXCH cytochrome family protein
MPPLRGLASVARTRAIVCAGVVLSLAGCGLNPVPQPTPTPPPSGPKTFVGSAGCAACHPDFAERTRLHAHANALTPLLGRAPSFPLEAEQAGLPNPPDGLSWFDLRWVIGGYLKGAKFVDADGNVVLGADSSDEIAYRLDQPATATTAGFSATGSVNYSGRPYGYDCFKCHTTGPERFEDNGGRRQDNRMGVGGTWAEAGVQCEACHGPGSTHIPAPGTGQLVIDGSFDACGQCHFGDADEDGLAVLDGFIAGNQQAAEVQASPHAALGACTVCHDPHTSVTYDRARAIRNACTNCHGDQNLARHAGAIYVRGDYVEFVSCESCHMPFATKTLPGAVPVGESRVGDGRSHLVKIDVSASRFDSKLGAGGTRWALDAEGQASITLDHVCLRCHDGGGNVFALTAESAAQIAPNMHE